MRAALFLFLILILHIQRFNQLHIGMFFLEILERELVREENQRTLEVVEYQHLSGIQDVFDGFDVVGVYPSCNAEIEAVHADGSIILVLKSVFKDFKLKLADRTDYNLVILVAVNLNRALLRELIHTFLELLSFHRIFWRDETEEFRREGWKRLEEERIFRRCQRIADLVGSRVINTDNIARDCRINGFTLVCHEHGGL